MYLVSEDKISKTDNKNPPQTKKEPSRKYNHPKKKKNKHVITKREKIQKKEKNNSQHDYDKRVEMRDKIRENEIRHNTQIKTIADFLQKVLPQQQNKKVSYKSSPQQHSDGENHTAKRRSLSFPTSHEVVYESLPSTSSSPPPPLQDVFYKTSKRTSAEIPSDDDDADVSPEIEEHVRDFGRDNFGELASPYLTTYVDNKQFLDKQYGIRKEIDGTYI
jgi:hypothetical protein